MKQYMQHRTGVIASNGAMSATQLPLPGLGTPEGIKKHEGLLNKTVSGSSGYFVVVNEIYI